MVISFQDNYADRTPLDYNVPMTATAAQLRRAQLRDLIQLRKLFVHALKTDFDYFPSAYISQVNQQHSLPRLTASLFKKQRIILLAVNGKKVIGYMVGSAHPDGVGELYWLYVHPTQRRQRLGSKLLQQALAELEQQGMHTIRLMTHQFEQYYAKFGFQTAGTYRIENLEVTIMQRKVEGQAGG